MKNKKNRKKERYTIAIMSLLRQHKLLPLGAYAGRNLQDACDELEQVAGIAPMPNLNRHRRVTRILEYLDPKRILLWKTQNDGRIRQFYDSYDWKKLRYSILVKYGRKCMACGDVSRTMHVDHIKPLRLHWNLRLDPDNLQVLCEVCNHGKGNWDETDWRPQVMIEIEEPDDPSYELDLEYRMIMGRLQ